MSEDIETKKPVQPVYLGDGVYAKFDGYHIWLLTSNGVEVTNSIAIEPAVYSALKMFAEKIWGEKK